MNRSQKSAYCSHMYTTTTHLDYPIRLFHSVITVSFHFRIAPLQRLTLTSHWRIFLDRWSPCIHGLVSHARTMWYMQPVETCAGDWDMYFSTTRPEGIMDPPTMHQIDTVNLQGHQIRVVSSYTCKAGIRLSNAHISTTGIAVEQPWRIPCRLSWVFCLC